MRSQDGQRRAAHFIIHLVPDLAEADAGRLVPADPIRQVKAILQEVL